MSFLHNETAEQVKPVIDIAALGAFAATLMDYVPHAIALLTLLWCALRIYDVLLSIQEKRRRRDQERKSS